MTANSSPPIRQTTSVERTALRSSVGQLGEHLVAHAVAVDVVHLLEVVDVDHHERDAGVGRGRAGQLCR